LFLIYCPCKFLYFPIHSSNNFISRQNIKFVVLLYYISANQRALNTKTILHFDIFLLQRKSLHNIVSEVCVSTVFIVNLTILFLVIFKLLTHEIHVKGHAIVHRVINPTFQLCVIRLQGQVIQQNSENANYIKSYNKVL